MTTVRNFSAEDVQKKLQQLPLEVKALLYSPEMTSVIQKTGEKNKLHFDQMGALELETSNVMLGFTDTADYPEMIMRSLSVERVQADAIAKDINDMLFVKIRDAMKNGEKSVVMPSSAAAASPAPIVPAAAILNPAPTLASAPQSGVSVPLDMQIEAPRPQSGIRVPLHEADVMLTEPTVSLPKKVEAPSTGSGQAATSPITPKVEPPPIYKADPYREPIE